MNNEMDRRPFDLEWDVRPADLRDGSCYPGTALWRPRCWRVGMRATYELSGPAALPSDQVRILGRVLGRDLLFEAQPDDEACDEMSAAMPKEYVDAFFRFYVQGELDESEVLPTVEKLTGRPPRTFEEWALDHVGAFRRSPDPRPTHRAP